MNKENCKISYDETGEYDWNDSPDSDQSINPICLQWNTKYFYTYEQAMLFIDENSPYYQTELIFIENGYGVEYKPLRIM